MYRIRSAKFHTEDGSMVRISSDAGESVIPAGQALLHGGLAGWLRAGGEIAPYYTIISARSANAEGTAVRATTLEAGDVMITNTFGKSDRWAALLKWVSAGGEIAPFASRLPVEAVAEASRLAQPE